MRAKHSHSMKLTGCNMLAEAVVYDLYFTGCAIRGQEHRAGCDPEKPAPEGNAFDL